MVRPRTRTGRRIHAAQGPCTTVIATAAGSAAIRIFFAGCPFSDGPPSTIPIPRVMPFITPNCTGTDGEERDDVEPDGPGVAAVRPRALLVLGSFT